MLREILRKPEARILFSIVIGIGLSVLMFHRPQKEIDMSAVSPNEIVGKVVRMDGKCYRFRIEDASCPEARLSL
jgi:hypothetical protein